MPAEVKDIQVAAHSLVLPQGKFCISVAEVSTDVPTEMLPGISVTAIPGQGDQISFARLGDSPWLREPGDAVLLQVTSAQARILLTSYNLAAAAAAKPPRMHIQRLDAPPPAMPAASAPPRPTVAAEAQDLLVHVANRGDLRGALGEWMGEGGDGAWIEGVQIEAPAGLPAEALEYQVVLGKGWTSPWSTAGEYCGSRGMTLPVQGLRIALRGEAERDFTLACEARTVSGALLGPVSAGELCGLEEPEPLAAIRVSIVRRPPSRGKARRPGPA